MNLIELLKFVPLIIGAVLAYHLIFRQNLPAKNIGSIITYFIGILIVFLAVSWLITTFLPDFANDLLDAGQNGAEWQQFIDSSEDVVNNAFEDSDRTTTTTTTDTNPNQVQIITVTATPLPPGVAAGEGSAESAGSGPTVYTVVQGDTLLKISRQFGVSVNDLRAANGLSGDLITVGQQLTIPAR